MSNMAVPADVFDPEAEVLLGSRCGVCGSVHFPPIDSCPDCYAVETERTPLARTGRIRSFTVVNLAFPGFPTPYHVVEVELPDGVVVLGQLDGMDDGTPVTIGLPVTVGRGQIRVDAAGEPVDGYRFVPTGGEG